MDITHGFMHPSLLLFIALIIFAGNMICSLCNLPVLSLQNPEFSPVVYFPSVSYGECDTSPVITFCCFQQWYSNTIFTISGNLCL